MPKVVRRTNSNGELESLDDLLRRFRRQVNDANILGECRKREFFISNGEKKKEKKLKKKMAIRKAQQEARREEYRERRFSNFTPELTSYQYPGRQVVKPTATPEEKVAPMAAPVQTKPAYYSYRKSAPKKEGK